MGAAGPLPQTDAAECRGALTATASAGKPHSPPWRQEPAQRCGTCYWTCAIAPSIWASGSSRRWSAPCLSRSAATFRRECGGCWRLSIAVTSAPCRTSPSPTLTRPPAEREAMALAMWENLGRVMVETMQIDRIIADPESARAHARHRQRVRALQEQDGCSDRRDLAHGQLGAGGLAADGRRQQSCSRLSHREEPLRRRVPALAAQGSLSRRSARQGPHQRHIWRTDRRRRA